MKCISLSQPWGSALLAGLHDIEYRCYPTDHRGDLLIHLARKVSAWDLEQIAMFGDFPRGWQELPAGHVVALIELCSCEPGSDGEWRWRLRNPRLVKPFPLVPGKRIFEVDVQSMRLDAEGKNRARRGRRGSMSS